MKYPGLIKEKSTNALAVKEIKKRLNYHLGTTLDVNNPNFGPATKSAVQQFQKSKLLIQDGIVGDYTWEKLFQDKTVTPPSAKATTLALRALEIMEGELHVRELTGNNDGPEIKKYLKSVGLGEGYPWCMAIIYWAFDKASAELGVKNPLKKTGGVLAQMHATEAKNRKYKDPQAGDIFIMDFGKGKGHAGIVKKPVADRVHTIDGNTSADPTIPTQDRDGNGVFRRSRKQSTIVCYLRFT